MNLLLKFKISILSGMDISSMQIMSKGIVELNTSNQLKITIMDVLDPLEAEYTFLSSHGTSTEIIFWAINHVLSLED